MFGISFRTHTLTRVRVYQYLVVISLLCLIFFSLWHTAQDAKVRYNTQLSGVIFDRAGTPIRVAENSKGHYVHEITELPDAFIDLLIKKEDQFFYSHPGINPISTARAALQYLTTGKAGGASTITQQLAKNLLGTETERNLWNKVIESFYALCLELFNTKDDILLMYANSVYLGNQLQGFAAASYAYFGKPLTEATHSEQIALLATLSHPSTRNPWTNENSKFATALNDRIAPEMIFFPPTAADHYSFQRNASFELRTAGIQCEHTCTTTIDESVTEAVRAILNRHINEGWKNNVRNGAVVVIDPTTLELIAMVGSRNPNDTTNGNQINMAIKPRPIGSTIKPFIFAKGFAVGLRPYTIVEDREYKYPIATGFPLYPKNYDGQYRGEVTLHEALSNSLNVPTVKTLEYIGLQNFYAFLRDDLKGTPKLAHLF